MGSCYIALGAQLGALDDLQGGMGGWERGSRGREIYVHLESVHVDVQQKPKKCCKAIYSN